MESFLFAVSRRNADSSAGAFAVSPIHGKGLGCVASRDIELGERLLAERPLLDIGPSSPETLEAALAALSEADQARFLGLSQNERKWGAARTVKGIFMTNAIPSHAFSKERRAVFATASRFNHACDANATFRWNAALGCITVHACRCIPLGTEICVHYGFPPGCVLREDRQRRLLHSFGFSCACSACSLEGPALRAREQALAAVGDAASFWQELGSWGAHGAVLTEEAGAVLERLDGRLQLLRSTCRHGHAPSVDTYTQMAVEFCEAVAMRVLDVLRHCPRTVVGGASIVVADLDELAAGEEGDEGGMLGLTPEELVVKVAAFVAAARAYAIRSKALAKDLRGADSPAYEVWARALRDGCWEELDLSSDERCEQQMRRGNRLNFRQLWIEAGLGPASGEGPSAAVKTVEARNAAEETPPLMETTPETAEREPETRFNETGFTPKPETTPFERARRLFLQRAPTEDVLSAVRAHAEWEAVDNQGLLAARISSKAVGSLYRQRVLKALMRELGTRAEVHEDLLEAYLESMSSSEEGPGTAVLTFDLPGCEQALSVSVVDHIGGGSETGGVLWPASLLLTAWLLRPTVARTLEGAHVLELGSGVGMLGLALAHATSIASITMTDYMVSTLDNLQRNSEQLAGGDPARVRVRQLDWNEEDSARRASDEEHRGGRAHLGWHDAPSPSVVGFDLVLAADVVYEPSVLPALVATLAKAVIRGGGSAGSPDGGPAPSPALHRCRALVASERRSEGTWAAFEALLKQHGLACRDLSTAAQECFLAQTSLHLPSETLPRMSLIELTDGRLV